MSNSLTVAQLLVLATAAQRPNHMVMPLPSTVRVRGGAQRNLLAALLRMELVEEIPVDDAAFAWRTDDAGRHLGLRLTAAGLAAAGVPEGVSPPPADKDGSEEQAPASSSLEPTSAGAPAGEPPARRPTGKLGDVLRPSPPGLAQRSARSRHSPAGCRTPRGPPSPVCASAASLSSSSSATGAKLTA